MQNDLSNGRGIMFVLFFIMVLSPMGPMADIVVGSADASGVSRHIYSLHDGSSEYVALYQGANPDAGAMISLPKGALVTDVSMTLSGASATGWSQTVTDDRDEWMEGTSSATDSRSGDLSLAFSNRSTIFFPHGYDEVADSASDAWLDNGSYAIRQPHTSNSTENRFSQQSLKTSSSLMKQGQGAILKHHDWLFMSTWSSSSFHNIVHRLYPNNATKESVITLDQGQCTLPNLHSSSYYGSYGFRDWTITDDERMFAILSGYRYHYQSSAPTQYHRVLEMDISRDDTWKCIDSYDVSPQYSDYTAIAYDRDTEDVWIVHNAQRRIVPYTFGELPNGQYTRGQGMFDYSSSSGSSWQCGKTGQQVRGLEVNQSTFFMRCQKGTSSQDKDQLEAWTISGSSTSLVPQSGTRLLSALGYGLQFDGSRFVTVDCGYSTWSSATLYYREYGTGWQYKTTPAPGTTTWYGPVTESGDPIRSVNMQTYWSAASIGDRVDYWVSADNGTHWESVESNATIHFDYPGNELVWKAQLIGSTAVSWWVDVEYSTEYALSGSWTSPPHSTGTKVGKVRPNWVADVPSGTTFEVKVSNDNGTTWLEAINNQEVSFPSTGAGDKIRYAVILKTTDATLSPLVDSITMEYEEGYPDRPKLDIGNDLIWDWESILFLNESAVVASDNSIVNVDVKVQPTLVQAFNSLIPQNGDGDVLIPIAVKAATSGRVKISNIDIAYKMQTRAIDASLEGGLLSPDGVYRNLQVRIAPGDDVDRVTGSLIALNNSYGENPAFDWQRGDTCSVVSDAGGIVQFDVANCTSTIDSNGMVSIRMPVTVNWTWDDESKMQALISIEDDLGQAVANWETEDLDIIVENDIQLDGLRVYEETGRELYSQDWVRGGFNLSFTGGINFQNSQLSPLAGQFSLRILGQNVTYDGDPIGEPILLAQEQNPAFGEYNITFQSPIQSEPGGMVFYVEAIQMQNGSVYANPGYNTIRLVLDGNSPLVLSSTPNDGSERHAGPPAPGGQAVSIVIQDSVDPPNQVTLNYWIGCKASEALGCSDYNFDGLPNSDEYEMKTLTSPDTQAGGLNIFEGLIDDSMLQHGQHVSYFITGKDAQDNEIAMGGGPVCPDSNIACGYVPGEEIPDWDNDLGTYRIRVEFEPELDLDNSTILGHDDKSPLHPGIPYTAQVVLSDRNGWQDIQYIQLALGGNFDDDETSVFISLTRGADGEPIAVMESGSANIAVSNLYSSVDLDETDNNIIKILARFQLTWTFPESFDTNGINMIIPKILVTDLPCNEGEENPCFEATAGLGNDAWSLDNDFRFDTMEGHIRAVELRDGTNHYNSDFQETLIGAGQALRVNGRVLFSEDETPAPPGAFDVIFGDYDNTWKTSTRGDGEFSLDLLIPSVPSGHLDLRLELDDLPGLAMDETSTLQRVRLAVDSSRPTIAAISLDETMSGSNLSIGACGDLLVMLETIDDHGFDLDEPAVLHYRVRAGEAEISRGSVPLPDTTPFGDQFFWTGNLDLTDAGATTLLPSYMVDVWVSGSDSAGNPFNTLGNTLLQPIASWPLALLGPSIDLNAATSSFSWDDPSPITQQSVGLDFEVRNLGGKGDVSFILQRAVEGGFWEDSSRVDLVATAGAVVAGKLPTVANVEAGENIEFRLLVLVDEVEMDRKTLDPLLVKGETIRDGEALALQAKQGTFSIVLYLIALLSLSLAMWLLVMNRRIREGELEGGASDQTSEVLDELNHSKALPVIDGNIPPPPGLMIPPPQAVPAPIAQATPSAATPAPPPIPPTG
ncbi:MAG TPA: hypothetical protein QF401_02800, partial [Candidatus Poseidoniaceae archaeon]|nr:hypothetical protein [Candidatus Poseidoniaceae archaeon]